MSTPFSYACGLTPCAEPHDPEVAREVGRRDAREGVYMPCKFSEELDQVLYDEGWRAALAIMPGGAIPQHYARNLSWRERRRVSLGMILVKGRR